MKARLALAAIGVLTACSHGGGLPPLTASSTCTQYLNSSKDQQDLAVQRIAGAQHNGAALTPLGRPNVDYLCGNDETMLLGEAVARAGGSTTTSSATTPATSAAPSASTSSPVPAACAGACFADPSQVSAILAAARVNTARVNSYDYRTLDQDRAAGLAVTTGAYRTSYRSAMSTVAAQAPKLHATQHAQTNQAGVHSITNAGTRAQVIVVGQLVQQSTATAGSTRTDIFTATVTLDRVGQRWLISAMAIGGGGTNLTLLPASSALEQAANAGVAEVHNLLTFSRATFDSDFHRALDGATNPLRSDVARNSKRTRAALTSGHFDLTGHVTGLGVVSADNTTVTLLVIAESRHTGGSSVSSSQNEMVTMKQIGGSWLAADLQSIGVQ